MSSTHSGAGLNMTGRLGAAIMVAAALALLTTGSAAAQPNKIYWTSEGPDTLRRVDLDGANEEILGLSVSVPIGIVTDDVNGKIYWGEFSAGTVRRADLDGANPETIITGLTLPRDIDLDLVNGKIYIVEDTGGVSQANLDGTNLENIVPLGFCGCIAVAVDGINGKVYWGESGDLIKRANLDGTAVETIVPSAGSTGPFGMDVDPVGGRIYFPGKGSPIVGHDLRRADLDGSNVELIAVPERDARGISLDLSAGKVYFLDRIPGDNKIKRVNLDGSGPVEVILDGIADAPTYAGLARVPADVMLACDGFRPPMDKVVTVRKHRALPLKAQLVDGDGFVVTDLDIVAAPVIQVIYDSGTEPAEDVTDEALSPGDKTLGNEFFFDADDQEWHHNLYTRNYSAPGTYTVTMVPGDDGEYTVDPTCEATFVING